MSTLGIIAGGGELPRAVGEAARESGRQIFLVALRGAARQDEIAGFPHDWVSLGEAGRLFGLLRRHRCEDVLFVGRVARPRFNEIRTDAKGILLMPRVIAAARKGDDALLRELVIILEDAGFRAVGVADAAPSLLAPEGTIGRSKVGADHEKDIALGVQVVRRLGALDIGQSAIVCSGLVLAVEAAEGTDATIRRVPELPESIRGSVGRPRGVLVKALKPTQDGKSDLPVIGVQTIANAHAAFLAGVAVEAGRSLILDRRAVIAAADDAGMFVTGFRSPTDG